MIRIQELKLNIDCGENDLENRIIKLLKINKLDIKNYKIVKKSIDARNKSDIKFVYTVDVEIENQEKVCKRANNKNISISKDSAYKMPLQGNKKSNFRPIIVGSGPAGLFCAYFLAKEGYKPILIEKGEDVDNRIKTVEKFWETNELNTSSNVQFGEGGAGTFSDGKLNTLVNDKSHRNKLVLETFVEHGGNPEITYNNKPHLGTDVLCNIVKSMREAIISNGGEVRFSTEMTNIFIDNNEISAIELNNSQKIDCNLLVLAIGHSARDTFRMLERNSVTMQQKAFAIGVRIEHPQDMISISQYGKEGYMKLTPAEYKLATKAANGRNVYSFCMCPGGYVVNSSSELKALAINGMSYSDRGGENANSAIVVSVNENDFPDSSPLSGISYMEDLEVKAYNEGRGKIPIQLFRDFKLNRVSTEFEGVKPSTKGNVQMANLRSILPEYVTEAIMDGIHKFGKTIKGFDREDCLLSAIETRTSSPVRILRDENFQSNIKGIYPCGEGAGYAGGITSSAMDGVKIFEEIVKEFMAFHKKHDVII